jgi:hypothetical protein
VSPCSDVWSALLGEAGDTRGEVLGGSGLPLTGLTGLRERAAWGDARADAAAWCGAVAGRIFGGCRRTTMRMP